MSVILLLAILLTICVISDFKSRKIPNSIVGIGLVSGLTLSGLNLNGDISLLQSVLGLLVGLCMLLPVYMIGKMGAGDVKLLAMCGSFLGAEATLMAGLCAFLAGGFFALIWIFLVSKIQVVDKRYPYAFAIATGTAMAPLLQFN